MKRSLLLLYTNMRFSGLLLLVLLLKAGTAAYGQCSGTALFKEDFGGDASSPEWGTALGDNINSYYFQFQSDISDGQYSIRKHTGPMHNWFSNGTDHTGDGYMMIINADFQPGIFYSKIITDLCQGSKFYFSAWIANLLPKNQYQQTPLDPGVKFEIRTTDTDSIIASLSTGTIGRFDNFTWVQYGISVDLPTNASSVKLLIYNDQPGGNGNDLALDDITFTLCGPPIKTKLSGAYKNSNDICAGKPAYFSATIDNNYYKNPQYQWQFSKDGKQWNDITGATALAYNINNTTAGDSGLYRFLAADFGNIDSRNCRIATAPIPLNVYQPMQVKVGSNSPVCEGGQIQLNSDNGISFAWSGPDNFSSDDANPFINNAQLAMAGRYDAHIITKGGCQTQSNTALIVTPNTLHLDLGNDTTLCDGDELKFDVTNAGAGYLWNDGSSGPVKIVKNAGEYSVKLSQKGCEKADTVHVNYTVLPKIDLGTDTSICLGEPLVLNATAKNVKNYKWQDGSTDSLYNVKTSGTYTVIASNACGEAKATKMVSAGPCADELIFPSAFTPNNDSKNDIFRPRLTFAVDNYLLLIYDRWGNLVFKSKDIQQGWNGTDHGKIASTGSYVWQVQYKKRDNSNHNQTGTLLLIR